MTRRTLGLFLLELRKRRGLSQREAALAVGVSTLTWQLWEQQRIPEPKHLIRIADWAAVSLDDLRPYLEAV